MPKKHLLTTPSSDYQNTGGSNHLKISSQGIVVTQKEENWFIDIDCKDKELAQIQIKMPNGKTWTGSIQSFMSIFQVAKNAMGVIGHGEGVTAEEQETNLELQNLLDHVK